MNGAKFFEIISHIDSILEKEGIDRALELLQGILSRPEFRKYFFEKLNDPNWLMPLYRKGFFSIPPEPQKDDLGASIAFPPWPESEYLARISSREPGAVSIIVSRMPRTENVRVCHDLISAILAMPPKLSAQLVGRTKEWVKLSYSKLLLPNEVGKLISHLSKGGEREAVLDLARTVLEVLPDPRIREKEKLNGTYSLPPEPTAWFDVWDYEEILRKNIPDLVSCAGMRAFDLLADLLEDAVRLSLTRGMEGAPDDNSWIWRPAVEDHPQNHPHGIRDSLVSSVRDTATTIVGKDNKLLSIVLEKLESRPWLIFWRISLHLIRKAKDVPLEIVSKRLTDRSLFDDSSRRHEYALLLEDFFKSLAEREQKMILSWIEEGPDIDKFMRTEEEFAGQKPTNEDFKRYRKYWQRDRLSWFKESLPEQWRKHYAALVAEIGEPEHSEFSSYSATWVGPTSPKDVDELRHMSIDQIAGFCIAWRPSKERMSPSPEGLGRTLTSIVAEDPSRFSENAKKFVGLAPTYVRSLFHGFRDAVAKGGKLAWIPVLELCSWAVAQPRELSDEEAGYRDEDPHWGWTRKAIADLLSSGFKSATGVIQYELRSASWNILRPLTEDPDPTPEHEAQYGPPNMDPATLSINTVRGEAMHAVMQYALWVRCEQEKSPSGLELISKGFEEIPEVREVLDYHLDPSKEHSLAIRAVYGQWFPWLVLLDRDWAKANAERIFPSRQEDRSLWDAAWVTYIKFCQAYDGVLEILHPKYEEAIDRLGEGGELTDEVREAGQRLADHLMVFYWNGKIDLNQPGGLLRQFWAKAPSAIRGKAIEYLGRILLNTKGNVAAEILERLKKLWQLRLFELRVAAGQREYLDEITNFGWWFSSAKFEDKWAIEQLIEVLKLSGEVEPNHLVVQRLAAISKEMPLEAVQCLDYLVRGDEKGWKLHGWREDAKAILTKALDSRGEAAVMAEDLIHHIGSRGFLEFRSLLKM